MNTINNIVILSIGFNLHINIQVFTYYNKVTLIRIKDV
jgi:hypothetical protein